MEGKGYLEYGGKQPRDTSLLVFLHSLSTLQEKQLVVFKANYDEVMSASLTVKGAAYLELNPKLKNPIDWKWIILAVLSAITAFSTAMAVYVSCANAPH